MHIVTVIVILSICSFLCASVMVTLALWSDWWEACDGKIVRVELVDPESQEVLDLRGPLDRQVWFNLHLEYEYVLDKPRKGTLVRFGDRARYRFTQAVAEMSRWHVDQPISVYVCPVAPWLSVLEPGSAGIRWPVILNLVLSSLVVAACLSNQWWLPLLPPGLMRKIGDDVGPPMP